MRRYLASRLLVSVFVILAVTVVAFASIQLIPADVVDIMLGKKRTPETAAALRHKLGLDQPPVVQYFRWVGGLVRGDLGTSLRTQEPIVEKLRQRLPVTIELAFLSTMLAILIGVPAGIIAAIRQYSIADHISTITAMLGLSMPEFWLATLLILLFSMTWKILPPGGLWVSPFENLAGNLKRMLMPTLSLGLPSAAIYFRMTRSSMLEVIRSDYMTTAYSKGLSARRVIVTHALKNALIPIITVAGLEVTWMLGGSFIVESIFSLPGLGRTTVQAIYERDFTVLQGCLLVYASIVVAVNLIVDMTYAWMDPRIRYD